MEFQLISFVPGTFKVKSVKRVSDGEFFAIGDRVTNGTKMQGKIVSFSYGDITDVPVEEQQLYITTDWSGVGMNLASISHVKKEEKQRMGLSLPSALQINQVAYLTLRGYPTGDVKVSCTVKAVHFYADKVKYDIELWLDNDESTKIYNIDSLYVLAN